MRFVKTEGTAELTEALVSALMKSLRENLKTLWLVPGGSNIPVVVEVMSRLPRKDLHRLVIMLSDERYGQIGHENSNYHQIMQAGFLPYDATFIQILSNSPLQETVDYMTKVVEKLFSECGAVIGFFGMGADGHICGIMPHSPVVASANIVEGYETSGFTRITLTPKALEHVGVAILGAFGEIKKQALENLRDKPLDVEDQPAQLIKQIRYATVFNDQVGDNT